MDITDLFTIGYSRRKSSACAEVLQANGVEIVVDVRRRASTFFDPDFAKTKLSAWLGQEGIECRHFADLGPSNALRQREKDGEIDRPEMLVIYRTELDGRITSYDEWGTTYPMPARPRVLSFLFTETICGTRHRLQIDHRWDVGPHGSSSWYCTHCRPARDRVRRANTTATTKVHSCKAFAMPTCVFLRSRFQ